MNEELDWLKRAYETHQEWAMEALVSGSEDRWHSALAAIAYIEFKPPTEKQLEKMAQLAKEKGWV